MVSKARLDLPLPLGPVTTVNLPSGRSTSMPLRLFWRAPRISTQPASASAVMRSFGATFEPTGNNSRWRRGSQILARKCLFCRGSRWLPWDASSVPYRLFLKPCGELLALLEQLFGNNAAERFKKLLVPGEFFFPFFVIDSEKFDDGFVLHVELVQIEVVGPR